MEIIRGSLGILASLNARRVNKGLETFNSTSLTLDINHASDYIYTGSAVSTVTLPQTTNLVVGWSVTVDNRGTGLVHIVSTVSGNITTILAGTRSEIAWIGTEWIVRTASGGGSGGESINGGVFTMNITGRNGDNATIINTSPGGVASRVLIDGDDYNISVLAITGHTDLKPVVILKYINSEGLYVQSSGSDIQVAITGLTPTPTERTVFDATVPITIPSSAVKMELKHHDGAFSFVEIEREVAPVIQLARFNGSYPNGPTGVQQSELKLNDKFGFYLESDSAITQIEFDNYGAFTAQTVNVTAGLIHTLSNINIANRGNATTNQGAKVRVKKATGSTSEWLELNNIAGVDAVDYVKLNNITPTITFTSVTYPNNGYAQTAIKDSEVAIVNHTITNASQYLYSSPNSQLSIANSTTYEAAKSATRIAGDYNIATNNFRVVATRTANGSQATGNSLVRIAHIVPIITVALPHARLRSGGNNGTSVQVYSITVTSNQQMLQIPVISSANRGTLGGSAGAQNISISDSIVKGAATFTDFFGVNLAGKEVTEFTAGSNVTGGTNSSLGYVVGGFVSRVITLPAFGTTVVINTSAETLSKLTLAWSYKNNMNASASPIGTVPSVDGGWSISALSTNPTDVIILDTEATNASSQDSTVTVEEIV